MKKKFLIFALAFVVLGNCTVVKGAVCHKDIVRGVDYHDSIITSWKVGEVNSYITFSYDDREHKLVDQKSAYVSGSVFMYSVKNKCANWDWYDSNSYYGSGQVTTSWDIVLGIDTAWIKVHLDESSVFEQTRVRTGGHWSVIR